MQGEALFQSLVVASRLTPVVAPFTLRRLLLRSQIFEPSQLTRADIARALPHIEQGLAVYLKGEELAAAMASIRRLCNPEDAAS